MIPISAIIYIIKAGIIVICLILGLRFIFAGQAQREVWRSMIKRYFYISPNALLIILRTVGVIMLAIGLFVAYLEVDRLLSD